MINTALFGLFFASCFSLVPSLLGQLVPLNKFTMAYGLILLCEGIGNLTGPPVAGKFEHCLCLKKIPAVIANFSCCLFYAMKGEDKIRIDQQIKNSNKLRVLEDVIYIIM